MKNISFVKYSGAGNDFILIDLSINNIKEILQNNIREMCTRHTGIGADGILLFDDSEELDFKLQYFNADGSTGSLCGNGARCAIHYAHNYHNVDKSVIRFGFNNEIYTGKVLSEKSIKFYFNEPKNILLNKNIRIDDFAMSFSFINTGSPHVIISIDELVDINSGNLLSENLNDLNVNYIGRQIRYNKVFAPDGVNVNFVHQSKTGIDIRTYERGVEGETLACATGAVAAAITEVFKGFTEQPVSVNVKSGEKLVVDFNYESSVISNLSLTGNVEKIYEGKIKLN